MSTRHIILMPHSHYVVPEGRDVRIVDGSPAFPFQSL